MDGKDKLVELINEVPKIKKEFRYESFCCVTSFDNYGNREDHPSKLETIYNNQYFIEWKEKLLFELGRIKQDDFIVGIVDTLGKFNGWSDKKYFQQLEVKLNIFMDNIDEYFYESNDFQNSSSFDNVKFVDRVIRSLSKLQRNSVLSSKNNENTFNDYLRDILGEHYEIKDQTRQGKSVSGKDAGEIDIQICEDGMPIVMIEALKLNSLNKESLSEHIEKVLTNYDPNGCLNVAIVIYFTGARFADFVKKLEEYLSDYQFPYHKSSESDLENIDTGYAEMNRLFTKLDRNGNEINLNFFIVHLI